MDATFVLPDKRRLGYDDTGDPRGKAVFYFHGVPSARVEWRMWGSEELLKALGVRLIAIDRSGVGLSTFQPGRGLSDWPADVTALADDLGIERFRVLGYSGGGPYAAVCACKIPERLYNATLVSSLAPFNLPGMLDGVNPGNVQFLRLAIEKPLLYQVIYWQLSLLAKYAPKQYLKRALATFEAVDRVAFSRPEVHEALFAISGTVRGAQWDTRLVLGAWDFRLEDIHIPVQVWHGDQDHNAFLAMGRYLAQTIPNCRTNFVAGEGHISLIVNHAEQILRALLEGEPEKRA